MNPPTLFDQEQPAQLQRVTGMIAHSILTFVRYRLTSGRPEFHADELRAHVAQQLPSAPASADRILRALRRAGKVRYTVVNRAKSLYRLF